ncbi:unnamed protein product [Nippostrongylus brasiliensis]|uniref:Sulfur globule protein CV1 domain protein n=1 Tax=Nippostrongylus brasiliensis TaxID=27835 RepID=A0A0N4YHT4_NIPBR|nr:unnamed protein product [Nippostrongylus brasiliensis]
MVFLILAILFITVHPEEATSNLRVKRQFGWGYRPWWGYRPYGYGFGGYRPWGYGYWGGYRPWTGGAVMYGRG